MAFKMNSIYLIAATIQLFVTLEATSDRQNGQSDTSQDIVGLWTGNLSPSPSIEVQTVVDTEHTDRNAHSTTNNRSIEDEYCSQSRLVVTSLGTIYSTVMKIKFWLATIEENIKSLENELSASEIEGLDGAAINSIRTKIHENKDDEIGEDISYAVDFIASALNHEDSFPFNQFFTLIYKKYQQQNIQCSSGESFKDMTPQILQAKVDDTILTLKQFSNLLVGLTGPSKVVGEGLTNRELAQKIYNLHRYIEEETQIERLFQTYETLNNLYLCISEHLKAESKT